MAAIEDIKRCLEGREGPEAIEASAALEGIMPFLVSKRISNLHSKTLYSQKARS
ncbi:MAG: hypothetical protein ACE14P_12395 [Methanotrichaceae archaeon]